MLKSSTDDYLSWDEVLEQQGFIDLPGEQKELARMAYFDEVVAPRVSRKYQRVARAEFDDYSLPTLLTNEQKDQIQRKQEIQDYEDAGGGVLSSLERGGRRLKQGLAGAGAALGGALIDDEGFFDTSPVGKWLNEQTKSDQEEVMLQQENINALPVRPEMARATAAAEDTSGYWEAGKAVLKEIHASPNTLGFVIDQMAELAPQMLTILVGTKGVDKILPIMLQGMTRTTAIMGGGGFLSSVANTYGPNIAEGIEKGLNYDQAESRAVLQSLAQGSIDALTTAIIPWKIGPNQFINVPAQTLIQMLGGGYGEILRSQVVGETASKPDVAFEALLEVLGMGGDIAAAVLNKPSVAAEDKPEDGGYFKDGTRFVPIDPKSTVDIQTDIYPEQAMDAVNTAVDLLDLETKPKPATASEPESLPELASALNNTAEMFVKNSYYNDNRELTEQEQLVQHERDQAFAEMDQIAAEEQATENKESQDAKDKAFDEMDQIAEKQLAEEVKDAEYQKETKPALDPRYVATKVRRNLPEIKEKVERIATDRKLAKQNKAFPKNSAMADALNKAGLKKPKGGDQSGGTGGGQPTSPTKPKGRIKSGDSSKHNALEFLRREGGINRNAATSEFVDEAQVKELNKSNIPLFPAEGKGLSIEEIAEKLRDNGYIPDDQNTYDNTLEILRSSLNQGNEHFSQNNTDYINKVYEEKAADEKAKWEARDKTAEAVTKSKERQAKKVAKKDKAENKAEAKAERSALQDTSPGGDASFDFGKNVKAEPIQESTTDSTGQVDVFGVDETAQAIEDKKQETKKKEKNAPDMAKGEGNLFSDISKQTDVEDVTKQKVKLQGTNEAGDNITVEMNADEALSMLEEKKNAYQQLLDCLT